MNFDRDRIRRKRVREAEVLPHPHREARAATGGPAMLPLHRELAQLQRTLGNRTTTGLLQDGAEIRTAGLLVQPLRKGGKGTQKKEPPLPGRQKRRLQAQDEELAEMARANEEWEAARDEEEESDGSGPLLSENPFALLEGEESDLSAVPEKPLATVPETPIVVQPVADPNPLIAALRDASSQKDEIPAIRKALEPYPYSQDVKRQISIRWRSSKSTSPNRGFTDKSLLGAAGAKVEEINNRSEEPAEVGTRANNTYGGPVSGLKKGKGDGYLAGEGGTWHVHYDHVKYGSNGATRVNFKGRTKTDILARLAAVATAVADTTNLLDCQNWINTYR